MVPRRFLLRSIGLAATATLTGCSGFSWPGDPSTDDRRQTPTAAPNATLAPPPTTQPTESSPRTATSTPTEEQTPTVTEIADRPAFTPATDEATSTFGTSVALSDDVALVDTDGERVHVFEAGDDGWHQAAVLTPGEEERFAFYPTSMALAGTTAYVGAPAADDRGAVYVFERDDDGWHRRTRISPNEDESDEFGAAVACDGETLVVGAVRQPSTMMEYSGTVSLFGIFESEWNRETTFESDDEDREDLFGRRVAFSDDTVLVGAPATSVNDESWAGAAYVYEPAPGAWFQAAKLTAPDVESGAEFGATVALDGDTAVVGAPGADGEAGSAYVFERIDRDWQYRARVSGLGDFDHEDGPCGVALSGETLLVGNPDASGAGRVSRYDRTEEGWQRTGALVPDDSAREDDFGYSVALAASNALVGAPTGAEDRRGRGYLFSL